MSCAGGWVFGCTFFTLLAARSISPGFREAFLAGSLILVAASPALLLLRLRKSAFFAAALAIALLAGSSFLDRRERLQEIRDMRAASSQGYALCRGYVRSFPEIGPDHSIFEMAVTRINGKPLEKSGRFGVRVNCRGDLSRLAPGTLLEADLQLRAPRSASNFAAESSGDIPLVKNIAFHGYLKSPQLITELRPAGTHWRLLRDWRNSLRASVARHLPGPGRRDMRAFLLATLLGDRLELESASREQMIAAGIFHFLAISGANVAMLAIIFLRLFSLLRVGKRVSCLLVTLLALFYLAISGFETTAARAVLMLALFLAGRVMFQQPNPFSLLAVSALILLFINPASFLDPSFLLTFALTFAIIAGRELFLPLLRRVPRGFAEFLSAGISSYLVSLPLSVFFFNRGAPLALLSTALLSLPVSAITFLSFLLIFALPSQLFQALLFFLLCPLLGAFFMAAKLFGNWEETQLWGAKPEPAALFFLLLLFWGAVRARRKKWRALFFSLQLLLTLAVINRNGVIGVFRSFSHASAREEKLYFLDFGGSDCFAWRLPQGETLLIDAGGAPYGDFNMGRNRLLPVLVQHGMRVNEAFISHFHSDHCRSLTEAFPFLKPKRIVLSYHDPENVQYAALLSARPRQTEIIQAGCGFRTSFGGIRLQLLWPREIGRGQRDLNNGSQVWLAESAGKRLLFCADIGHETEQEILRSGIDVRAEIIKIAHHGSPGSSSPQFLRAVHPWLAVITARRPLSPGSGLKKTLRSMGTRILETARHGAVRITFRGEQLTVEVAKDKFDPVLPD